MALTGMHVVAGTVGSVGPRGQAIALFGQATGSETLATPGTSALVAIRFNDVAGFPAFRCRTSTPAWVSHGANPADPSLANSVRYYVPADEDYDIVVAAGDKLRWALA